MSMTNVEVTKNPNENPASLLRRFSRRVQEAGIIPKVKGNRYAKRKTSKLSLKAGALKRKARRTEVEKLRKLGKMS
jgi:ribosomal protein S21